MVSAAPPDAQARMPRLARPLIFQHLSHINSYLSD
jgi:hypothetical protein